MSETKPWSQPTEAVRLPDEGGSRSRRGWIVALVALVLVLAISAGTVAYYSVRYRDRIYPGVSAMGVSLSGMTAGQAKRALTRQAERYTRSPLVLTAGGKRFSTTPEELGLTLDSDWIVRHAYATGRKGSAPERWRQVVPFLSRPVAVTPRYILDKSRIEEFVRKVARRAYVRARSSELTIRQDGYVVATPGVWGKRLSEAAASDSIYSALSHFRTKPISLPMRSVRPDILRSDWGEGDRLARAVARRPITLRYGRQEWKLTPGQIASTVQIQRGTGAVVGYLDPQKVMGLLQPVQKDLHRDPRNADLRIVDARAVLTPDRDGREVDLKATAASVLKAVATGSDASVSVDEIPAKLTAAQLGPSKSQLDRMLSGPTTLTFEDQEWTIPVRTLAGWIRVTVDQKRQTALIDVDEDAVRGYVRGLSAQVYQKRESGALTWDDDLVVTKESTDGHRLRVGATTSDLVSAIRSGRHSVGMSVAISKPRVPTDDPSALGIREPIGQGRVSLAGDWYDRATNARTAAGRLNDTVVAPGERFSLRSALGAITGERGYVQAPVMQTYSAPFDFGGGVDELATALFRALFWSGVPITDRRPYPVIIASHQQGGAAVGLDAMFSASGGDVRWTNNTGHYVLVEARTEDDELVVTLYGTNPGWRVVLGGPSVTETAKPPKPLLILDPSQPPGYRAEIQAPQPGENVAIRRTVTKNGSTVRTDRFESAYSPLQAVWKVGPKPPPPPKHQKHKPTRKPRKGNHKKG